MREVKNIIKIGRREKYMNKNYVAKYFVPGVYL